MAKVVTFGEIMLRLSPPAHQRFTQAVGFDAVYGGAEANVVIGIRTRVVAIQIENASVRRVVPIPTAEEATFNVMYPKYLFAY